ncbi:glycoside hydrolase family 3 protein [Wenjunlia tyrosinilytica]|uniref:Sugar hydrolase n=1 Tax=Wenjunlia tyrosinilytica TaxID=1544741 RepID=A0A917ZYR1_9ACTN|nr:glycoside hydrolase family 3 N-terminal domain-containing protein [Wenjunlia tyrosinilytica]GGP00612.1 sugar hydrolase [Wenjunlia tyrosinilytica]
MTVHDDLHQWADACLLPGFAGLHAPDWVRRKLASGLAGVVLYHDNVTDPAQLSRLTAQLLAENPAALIGIDEEGGDVSRLEVAEGSSWPGNHALGHIDDLDLTRAVATEIGRSLACAGVNLNLGPVADVNNNPSNPVIGVRSFGCDHKTVAAHTAAYIEGLQSVGVAACAKHFPGHGNTTTDSHHERTVVEDTAAEFEATAFPPFKAAIRAGVRSIMTAHITATAFDAAPATISAPIVTGLLRDRLGYDGVVITDSLEMAAIEDTVGLVEGAVQALIAGVDALCLGVRDGEARTAALREAIVGAVRQGRLPEQRLAQAAARISALSSWTASHREGGVLPDRALGLAAARRALHSTGINPLTTAPVVIELVSEPNPAVGHTSWGLGSLLCDAFPGTRVDRYEETPADPLHDVPAATPVVITVRDAHRHPWISAAAASVVARRPDAVLVEMGLPHGTLPSSHRIVTHGAARVCAQAAAEALLGTAIPVAPGMS